MKPRLGSRKIKNLVATIGLLCVSSIVLAHDIYSDLRDRDGRLCCNGQDCRPVEATVLPDGNYFLPATDETIPADIATPFGAKLGLDAFLLQCTLRKSRPVAWTTMARHIGQVLLSGFLGASNVSVRSVCDEGRGGAASLTNPASHKAC